MEPRLGSIGKSEDGGRRSAERMVHSLWQRLPGSARMVNWGSTATAIGLAMLASSSSGHSQLCEMLRHPIGNMGRTFDVDAVFSSDALEHSYLVVANCKQHNLVIVARDNSGKRGGGPSLFWQLAKAYRQSTPGHWVGVAARARIRLTASGEGVSATVESIQAPKLIRIAPPGPPPPHRR